VADATSVSASQAVARDERAIHNSSVGSVAF